MQKAIGTLASKMRKMKERRRVIEKANEGRKEEQTYRQIKRWGLIERRSRNELPGPGITFFNKTKLS
jgi:hypothetical protein